ncbi:hypothetical protein KTC96_18895 [Clostridium estertheticum]|uniref:hypothetical protein n=1 Tax=Clostridium estertheticum TaxID=238834 RepID=UPI001C7D69E7|nr:hypothetical protein [Clostridium estertheticum]MBX4258555.1 hypothetical protein [Clostridium estertheticum]WLC69967.1 hypothetical protein KTC96_18895 [Clostridium estertheticum]
MNNLESILKLSYSPMTVFEFDIFREDKDICDFLEATSVYIIAKRKLPIMRLIDSASNGFKISVTMNNNSQDIEILMLQEDNIKLLHDGLMGIRVGNNTESKDEFHSITLLGKNERFIMNANMDRLIHLDSNKKIKLRVKGDIVPFITYEVLYIGQCTEEHIFKRFKSHHALMDILIKEKIIPPNYDKVNDLLILPFNIESNIISELTGDSSEKDLVEGLTGRFSFDNKTISLDCEKALIKAMDPKYNKQKFRQYPKSMDGLYNHNLKNIIYRIEENIILEYGNDNKINGSMNPEEASIISIKENNDFSIIN